MIAIEICLPCDTNVLMAFLFMLLSEAIRGSLVSLCTRTTKIDTIINIKDVRDKDKFVNENMLQVLSLHLFYIIRIQYPINL